MKKQLLSLCLALLTFTACSVDEPEQPLTEKEKATVTFNVSDLAVSVGDFKSGSNATTLADSVKKFADYLSCKIYDNNGTPYTIINQTKSTPNFGTFRVELPVGSYKAAFAASTGNFSWNVANNYIGQDYIDPGSRTHDLFFKKIDQIKVSEDAVQEVTLDRIVSGIDLVVEDSIPSVVSSISIITKNEGSVHMVLDGISRGSVPTRTATFTIGNADRRILNKTFTTYALPNDGIDGTAVEIKAFDASAKELVSKQVKVDYIRNKKITIKGKLFTGLSTGNSNPNFSIKVNETWDKGGVEIKLP